jgi:cytochrome c553
VLGKTGDPKVVDAGRAIFEQGLPSANVPACLTCHGKDGVGNAAFPRLAGQHPEYLLKQLVMFKSELRAGASAPVMHAITTGLTFDQMQAVSVYLTSRPKS